MPGFNGTGPAGAGSMTGRGLGSCGKDPIPLDTGRCGHGIGLRRGMAMRRGPGFGRGCGLGCARGFGQDFGAWAAPAPEMDAEAWKGTLEDQKGFLKARLETIDQQLEKL